MATKPNRIQAKQLYAYVESTPTRRIKTFDWNSNFSIESIYELGNAGIVEDTVTLVETGITVNSHEWGSTDLEAMIFGIYEQRNILGNGAITGVDNTVATLYISSRGAGGVWSAPATGDWLQVIRTNTNATTNDATYVKIASMKYVPASQSTKIGLDRSYLLPAAPATGDVVGLVNKYTITQDTVDSNPVHFILPHRYSASSTLIMHSVILPRCYTDNLTYRLDVSGASEENYSLVGEEEILTLGSKREMHSIAGSFCSYAEATITFTIPRDSLAATASPYKVYADNNTTSTIAYIDHTSGQVTIQARIGDGKGVDANTQLIYYYHMPSPRGYKAITNLDSGIGQLTKDYIEIWLSVGSGTVEQLSRVSGVDISMPLTRESIDEFGNSQSVAKPLEGNLRNELTLTFTRNDLREYAKLLGEEAAFDAGTLKEILMTNLKAVKTANITIKMYNHQTTHDTDTLLKTMTFENCNFIGDNTSNALTGASSLELKFSTQSLDIAGSGNPPTYST